MNLKLLEVLRSAKSQGVNATVQDVTEKSVTQRTTVEGRVAFAAIVSATAALACGVCCILPFALPTAVLAVTGGALAWFDKLYPAAAVIAVGMVGASWAWIALHSYRAKRKPARLTWASLAAATLILGAGLLLPLFEERESTAHSQSIDEAVHR